MITEYIKNFQQANEKSDKTLHHGYQRFYPYFLEPIRKIENLRLLELGYDKGFSIPIWKKYFINPIIDSIDIIENPNDKLLNNYYQVNQDKIDELDEFAKNCSEKYHFIIDDASHIPTHQWDTFIRFFGILEDGGIYIIEDTETNFWGRSWQYGFPINSFKSSIYDKVTMINQFINSEFIEEDLKSKYHLTQKEYETLSAIEMITIAYNCIIFVKKSKEHEKYYRTFENYKHKGMVHLEDLNKRTPIQKIADFFVNTFRSK